VVLLLAGAKGALLAERRAELVPLVLPLGSAETEVSSNGVSHTDVTS
jgi:hypothetical protein